MIKVWIILLPREWVVLPLSTMGKDDLKKDVIPNLTADINSRFISKHLVIN